jgi:hypothetical protein
VFCWFTPCLFAFAFCVLGCFDGVFSVPSRLMSLLVVQLGVYHWHTSCGACQLKALYSCYLLFLLQSRYGDVSPSICKDYFV